VINFVQVHTPQRVLLHSHCERYFYIVIFERHTEKESERQRQRDRQTDRDRQAGRRTWVVDYPIEPDAMGPFDGE